MEDKTKRLAQAKVNQRLLKNIKRRIARLEKNISKYGKSPALEKLDELNIPMHTRGLSLDELKSQYRDLMYFQTLRTSYVKGLKNYSSRWKGISPKLDDKEYSARFSSLYSRFVEEHAIMSHYKYEVYDLIAAYLDDNASDKTIHDALEQMFNDIQYGGTILESGDAVRLYYIPTKPGI